MEKVENIQEHVGNISRWKCLRIKGREGARSI
jgi:hypothetical protein